MKYILITLIGLSLLNVSFARGNKYKKRHNQRVQKRQFNQGKRIGHGLRNGELTKKEAKRLAKGQYKVQKYKKKAKKDGKITLKERARMEKMQNRQSRRIYKAKHNDRSRNGNQDGVNDNSQVDPSTTD